MYPGAMAIIVIIIIISSKPQQQLPRRLPPLQVLVRLPRLLQRIRLMDLNIQLPILDEIEQHMGIELEFLSGYDVVVESGAGDVCALGRQVLLDVDGRHGPGAGAEVDDGALAADGLQRALPGVRADAVEDDGDAADFLGEVLDLLEPGLAGVVFVVDDELGAGGFGEGAFFGPARRADRARPDVPEDLAQEEADAAGGGVHEHPVALLHGVAFLHQRQGGHAHQEAAHRPSRR